MGGAPHTGFEFTSDMVVPKTARFALVGKLGQLRAVGWSKFEPSQKSIDHLTAQGMEMPKTRASRQGISGLYAMSSKRASVVRDSSTENLPAIELVAMETEHSTR